MDKEYIGGRMDQFTKGVFEVDCYMEKGYGNLNKMTVMKANIGIIKNTATEHIDGATAWFLMDILRKMILLDKERLLLNMKRIFKGKRAFLVESIENHKKL